MKSGLMLLAGIVFLVSCSKNEVPTEKKLILENISSEKFQTIKINSNDTLRLSLGFFGDEEGARIFKAPAYAAYDSLYRALDFASIYYEYLPLTGFFGQDTVGLILNRGSDGASPGVSDSTWICIVTN